LHPSYYSTEVETYSDVFPVKLMQMYYSQWMITICYSHTKDYHSAIEKNNPATHKNLNESVGIRWNRATNSKSLQLHNSTHGICWKDYFVTEGPALEWSGAGKGRLIYFL
jgi:hypothetical protein